jgi:hypothetical protein
LKAEKAEILQSHRNELNTLNAKQAALNQQHAKEIKELNLKHHSEMEN